MSLIKQSLIDLLETHEVIKIQFKSFDFWYRINDVSADIVAYTKHGALSEFTFDWLQIQGDLTYAFEEEIKNNDLYGENIAQAIPKHIEIVNKNGLDLRTKRGLLYQYEIHLNSGS